MPGRNIKAVETVFNTKAGKKDVLKHCPIKVRDVSVAGPHVSIEAGVCSRNRDAGALALPEVGSLVV